MTEDEIVLWTNVQGVSPPKGMLTGDPSARRRKPRAFGMTAHECSRASRAGNFRPESEAPNHAGGGLEIVLRNSGVVPVKVVALQSPGEILEGQLVISAAAKVQDEGVVDKAVGSDVTDSGHGLHEGAPFAIVRRETRTADANILRDAGTVETAAIDRDSEMRVAWKREGLEGGIEAVIALFIDHIGEMAVGDSDIGVAIGK